MQVDTNMVGTVSNLNNMGTSKNKRITVRVMAKPTDIRDTTKAIKRRLRLMLNLLLLTNNRLNPTHHHLKLHPPCLLGSLPHLLMDKSTTTMKGQGRLSGRNQRGCLKQV